MEYTDIEELKELLLTCNLCEEEAFTDGRDFHTLPCPCQHTICESCLSELIKKTKRHELPLCPWCRQEFVVPESGKLPTFRYAAKVFEELESSVFKVKVSSKSKSKSKNFPEKKKKNEKLTLLEKFNISHFKVSCAGQRGLFYGKVQRGNFPHGLACLNVVSGEGVTLFGSPQSDYLDMVYNGVELFAVNSTYGRIEVYKNITHVRSWKISCEQLLWCKIFLCPCNRLLVVMGGRHNWRCVQVRSYSSFGLPLHNNHPASHGVREIVLPMISNSIAMTVHHGSCWILNKEDKHLWEIPMKLSMDSITCKEPVKHCKVGDVTDACRWGNDKILFVSGKLVKVLDLQEIKAAHDSRVTHRSRSSQGVVVREAAVKATVHNLLSSVCEASDSLMVSDDGFVLVTGQDSSVTAYKFTAPDRTATPVEISDATIAEPEYVSPWKHSYKESEKMVDKLSIFLGNNLLSFVIIVLLSITFPVVGAMLHNFIEEFVMATCQVSAYYFNTIGRSYGWSNLHISFCENTGYNYMEFEAKCRT